MVHLSQHFDIHKYPYHMLCLNMQPFLPSIQLRLGSTLNRFQTFSFLHRPTSHNWYKTAAPVGWSVESRFPQWEPVCLTGEQTGQPSNQVQPSNQPTGQLGEKEAKTASTVRLGHQPAAVGPILFTGTLDHQVVKSESVEPNKRRGGRLSS